MPGSLSSMRVISPRTTAEASTTMTRVEPVASFLAMLNIAAWVSDSRLRVPLPRLQQADLGELGLDDFAVERLHDVFVRARRDRFLDVLKVVLGGAE